MHVHHVYVPRHTCGLGAETECARPGSYQACSSTAARCSPRWQRTAGARPCASIAIARWSVAVVNLFVKRKRDVSSLYLCCTISLTFECLRLCLQKTQRRPTIYEQMRGYSKLDCTASTAENRMRDAGSGPLFAPHVVRRGNAHEAAERLGQQAPAASTAEPHLRSLQMQQRQGCNWRRVSPPWR